MSSSTTKPIYRNPNRQPGHAGKPPVMRTLDTQSVQRLGRAGHVSGPVRRRAFGKRTAIFLLLVGLVLAVIFIASTSRPASAQAIVSPKPYCQVSAPPMPAAVGEGECVEPRAHLPII